MRLWASLLTRPAPSAMFLVSRHGMKQEARVAQNATPRRQASAARQRKDAIDVLAALLRGI